MRSGNENEIKQLKVGNEQRENREKESKKKNERKFCNGIQVRHWPNVVQNSLMMGHLILHFTASSRVSELVNEQMQRVQQRAGVSRAECRKQINERYERCMQTDERVAQKLRSHSWSF